MPSTPLSLWTNSSDSGLPVLSSTPKAGSSRTISPIKATHDPPLSLSLSLRSVLGTTTCSTSGFDCLRTASCFATCAGSAVVLHYLDENYNITQKFFRAKPSAVTDTATAPSTPETRNRQVASLRTSILPARGISSPSNDVTSLSGKGSVRPRNRAATCVALSPDGKLLAVGEVSVIRLYVDRVLNESRLGTFQGSYYFRLQQKHQTGHIPSSPSIALVFVLSLSHQTRAGCAQ